MRHYVKPRGLLETRVLASHFRYELCESQRLKLPRLDGKEISVDFPETDNCFAIGSCQSKVF